MAFRLRIARLDPSAYELADDGLSPTAETHQRLDALIRAHLPPVAASLLAQPSPSADGTAVEWHSDLAGQPIPLGDLPAAQREAVRLLLASRLRSLAELAERLQQLDAGARAQATDLRRALNYPGESAVYSVGGQPVITFWGYKLLGQPAAAPPAPPRPPIGAAAAEGGASATGIPAAPLGAPLEAASTARVGRRVPAWLWLVAVLLALGLGTYAAQRLGWGMRWPPWGPDYVAMLLAARADEAALRAQMAEIEAQLQERLAVCSATGALAAAQAEGARLASEIEELERALKDAVALCPLRQELEAARADGDDLSKEIDTLEAKLAGALAQCRKAAQQRKTPPPVAAADTPAPASPDEPTPAAAARDDAAPTPPPALASCPGIRPPEEAPDVAIVLDASGSMRIPASTMAGDIQREMQRVGGVIGMVGSILAGTGPSRLDEAKKGVNSVVRSLPDDVDVGLAVLKQCPGAENLGFFTGAQRDRLYALVSALRPTLGTPLAQGLEVAGGMVDGVKAPAVMVVISDGEDSCSGDPCATARALKARKPQLTINVVDIIGNGAGSCMAAATGGKVLTPDDGLKFEKTIREAAEQVLKPAHCP